MLAKTTLFANVVFTIMPQSAHGSLRQGRQAGISHITQSPAAVYINMYFAINWKCANSHWLESIWTDKWAAILHSVYTVNCNGTVMHWEYTEIKYIVQIRRHLLAKAGVTVPVEASQIRLKASQIQMKPVGSRWGKSLALVLYWPEISLPHWENTTAKELLKQNIWINASVKLTDPPNSEHRAFTVLFSVICNYHYNSNNYQDLTPTYCSGTITVGRHCHCGVLTVQVILVPVQLHNGSISWQDKTDVMM